MGLKKDRVNSFDQRANEVAEILITAGKTDIEHNKANTYTEREVAISEIENKTQVTSQVENNTLNKKEEKTQDETKVSRKKDESNDLDSLFIIGKKSKVKKDQKTFTLKPENIEILEKLSQKTGMYQNEVIDFLIEKFAEQLKVK